MDFFFSILNLLTQKNVALEKENVELKERISELEAILEEEREWARGCYEWRDELGY